MGLLNFYKDQSRLSSALDEASDNIIFEVILSISRNFERVDDFYAYIHKCICDETGEPTDEEERKRNEVILSTIHKTKGSEYNNVVYFNLSQDERISKESDIEEERRVSYVGVARAKNNILITAPKDKPSTFLKELAFNPELKEFSITEMEAKKNSKQMEVLKLTNKINTKEAKIKFLLNKYPKLKGEIRKYSYSFLNPIFLWLREKHIEFATKRMGRLNSEVESLNISKRDLLDSIDDISTEIEFRGKLT